MILRKKTEDYSGGHTYARKKIFSFILGIRRERDAPDTSYYQWVTFVLLFQAGCFLLPFKV